MTLPTTTEGVQNNKDDGADEVFTGHESILVIDDEPAITDIIAQQLERLGYGVTVLNSSVRALEHCRAEPNRYDLVVTDMTMPVLTGKKIAAELLQIRGDLPIILCTGYSDQISQKEAAALGIQALLHKPVSRQLLARTVRRALDAVNDAKG